MKNRLVTYIMAGILICPILSTANENPNQESPTLGRIAITWNINAKNTKEALDRNKANIEMVYSVIDKLAIKSFQEQGNTFSISVIPQNQREYHMSVNDNDESLINPINTYSSFYFSYHSKEAKYDELILALEPLGYSSLSYDEYIISKY